MVRHEVGLLQAAMAMDLADQDSISIDGSDSSVSDGETDLTVALYTRPKLPVGTRPRPAGTPVEEVLITPREGGVRQDLPRTQPGLDVLRRERSCPDVLRRSRSGVVSKYNVRGNKGVPFCSELRILERRKKRDLALRLGDQPLTDPSPLSSPHLSSHPSLHRTPHRALSAAAPRQVSIDVLASGNSSRWGIRSAGVPRTGASDPARDVPPLPVAAQATVAPAVVIPDTHSHPFETIEKEFRFCLSPYRSLGISEVTQEGVTCTDPARPARLDRMARACIPLPPPERPSLLSSRPLNNDSLVVCLSSPPLEREAMPPLPFHSYVAQQREYVSNNTLGNTVTGFSSQTHAETRLNDIAFSRSPVRACSARATLQSAFTSCGVFSPPRERKCVYHTATPTYTGNKTSALVARSPLSVRRQLPPF